MEMEKDNRLGLTLSAIIPEEPPVGTVVVTENGKAWQSSRTPFGVRWVRGGYGMSFDIWNISWLELIATGGPLTIVWIPKIDDPSSP